jgi:hypothetical protein
VPVDVAIEVPVYNEGDDDYNADDASDLQPAPEIMDEDMDDVEPHYEEPAIVPRYELHSSRERSYGHRLDHQMDDNTHSKTYVPPTQLLQRTTNQVVTAYVMTQMSAASGIKTYGQPEVDAILKEFCQLHDKGDFHPKLASTLTMQQKNSSIRAVNLIKEKRNGDIKGRICADGSVQRNLYDKSETTSPTVANDALMYSIIIDATERCDVATADVVGAYLNADRKYFTLMKLTGEAVGIMIQVNKDH